jgi:Ca-activated chloride channel family protein
MFYRFASLAFAISLIFFTALAQSNPTGSTQKDPAATRSGQSSAQIQDSETTIKVADAALVNIAVIVNDKQDRYIPNLHADDFTVFENGIKQEISFFSEETAPFHVVILLDTSGSTRGSLFAIQQAAKEFIRNLRPDDQVIVASFASQIVFHNRFSANRAELLKAISAADTEGSTRLYDAVLKSARDVLKNVDGRKAIILLTDGFDTSSFHTKRDALKEAAASQAIVYVLRYPEFGNGGLHYLPVPAHQFVKKAENQDTFLSELVEITGGKMAPASSYNALPALMRSVAEELRHTYTIGYYPANPIQNGGYRKIEVRLRDAIKATLRYRQGYNAGQR